MATSRISGEVVDVSAFSKFAKTLRKVAPDSAKNMRKGLKVSGEIIAEKTRANASFSKRIPETVKVRVTGVSVSVVVGGDKAPHAAPIENKGKGKVRHPVFGDMENWTDKNSHDAFFKPSVTEGTAAFRVAMTEVLDGTVADVVREMGG